MTHRQSQSREQSKERERGGEDLSAYYQRRQHCFSPHCFHFFLQAFPSCLPAHLCERERETPSVLSLLLLCCPCITSKTPPPFSVLLLLGLISPSFLPSFTSREMEKVTQRARETAPSCVCVCEREGELWWSQLEWSA